MFSCKLAAYFQSTFLKEHLEGFVKMKPFWRLLDESPKFFTSPCCVQKSVMKISCDDIETSQFLDNLGINERGDFMEVTKSF